MLRITQALALTALGIVLWAFVTYRIRMHPEAALDQHRALIGFVTGPLGGLISVWLCKLVGRLATDQLVSGVALVGAVAMGLDGLVLAWAPSVYAPDEAVLRHSAAGLLWGYAMGLAVALVWQVVAQARQAAKALA